MATERTTTFTPLALFADRKGLLDAVGAAAKAGVDTFIFEGRPYVFYIHDAS